MNNSFVGVTNSF